MQQGERRGARRAGAIFDATLTLLAERGYDGLTIEGVAARSGVNKTTIYRRWPSKDRLLGAALLDSALVEPDVPDTGSPAGDLRELVRHVTRLLTEEPVASVATAALSAFPRAGRRPARRRGVGVGDAPPGAGARGLRRPGRRGRPFAGSRRASDAAECSLSSRAHAQNAGKRRLRVASSVRTRRTGA